MASPTRRVFSNAVNMYAAEGGARVLQLILYVVAARSMEPGTFGDLAYLATIVLFASILLDFGTSLLTMKEVAQSPESLERVIRHALAVRWVLAIPASALALGWTWLRFGPGPGLSFVTVSIAGFLASLHIGPIGTALRALNQSGGEARIRIVTSFSATALAVAALGMGYGIVGIAVGQAAGSALGGAWAAVVARSRGISLRPAADGALDLLRRAAPLGLQALLGLLYLRVGFVALSEMAGASALGIYSAAYRLIEPLYAVPAVVAGALFPVAAGLIAAGRTDQLRHMAVLVLRVFFAMALPLAVIATRWAPPLIHLVYGPGYEGAAPILRVVAWCLIATFLTGITSTLINAGPRPHVNTWIAGAMVAINLGLNVALVPWFGAVGTAVACVSTEFAGLACSAPFVRRVVVAIPFLEIVRRPVAAAALSLPALLVDGFPGIALFAAAYAALFVLFDVMRNDLVLRPAGSPGRGPSRPTGVIWIGPVYDRGGYGSVARNYLRALQRAGIPVRSVAAEGGRDHSELRDLPGLAALETGDAGPNPAVILHTLPSNFDRYRLRDAAWRIGSTIFETDGLPDGWAGPCNLLDETWVPSEFNRRTFTGAGVRRVRVVPYAVDTDYFVPGISPLPIEGRRRFAFLYVFEMNWRKAFDLLIEAYLREFDERDDVTLILKCYPSRWLPGPPRTTLERIVAEKSEGRPAPPIVILDQPVSQDDLRRLYAACDVYVSTDRANGWGMPCMEAMALGKAAATVDWSGSTEFMNRENSLLIPARGIVPVDARLASQAPLLYQGHREADVRVEDVRDVLRWSFTHPEELRSIAERGMNDIRSRYSLEAIGRHLAGVLESLPPRAGSPRISMRRPGLIASGWRHWRELLARSEGGTT